MKKFLIYIFSFVFICFILPALLTKRDLKASTAIDENNTVETSQQQTEIEQINYEYKNQYVDIIRINNIKMYLHIDNTFCSNRK